MLGSAARAEPPRWSGTLDFSAGSMDVAKIDGFAAPDLHLDLGRELGSVRLQAELDYGMWTNDSLPETAARTGAFARVGAGIRWYWMDLDREKTMRIYLEGSAGREWIGGPGVAVARDDAAFGFGFAQEQPLGKTWLGGHTGVRVLVAGGGTNEVARAACRGTCPVEPHQLPDVAVMYVLGVVFGR